MPKKAKTPEQEQEILETGMEMEQQAVGGGTPPEGVDDEQPGLPGGEDMEPDAGGIPEGPEADGGQEDGGSGSLGDGPDPALDPSLVIPTLPQDGDGIQEDGGIGDLGDGPDPALDPSLVIPTLRQDGTQEDGGIGDLGDGPDPALDPSLVIPTLPQEEQPLDEEPGPETQPSPPPQKSSRKGNTGKGSILDIFKRPKPADGDTAADSPAPDSPKPAAKRAAPPRQQQKKAAEPTKRVVSIDEEMNIQTEDEKEAYLWMELRHSLRTKRILTGILGGVERSANGLCTAVVYYKDQRIVIPASEMFINIGDDAKRDQKALYNRYAQILTRSLGAEMDFVVSGIDRRGSSVVASRKEAMVRKQQNFYLPTIRNKKPLISEGQVVEARVISVGDKNMRVEAFGVEATILARDVAWEWVDDCTEYYRISDRVLIKILRIDTRDPQNIHIGASIRDVISNPARENIKKCVVQGKYIGKVTGVDKNAVYVRLSVGVNALAIAVHDRKIPSRKDDVSFVITRIDKEAGIAIGIITKVIKQFV